MISREDLFELVRIATAGDGHERSDHERAFWWDSAVEADWHFVPAKRALDLLVVITHGVIMPADITARLTVRTSLRSDERRILTPAEMREGRERRLALRQHAQTIPCPDCGAPAGEPCRGWNGAVKVMMDCFARVRDADYAARLVAAPADEHVVG